MSTKQRNLKEFRRKQKRHLAGTLATMGGLAVLTHFIPDLAHVAERGYELLALVALEILFFAGLD